MITKQISDYWVKRINEKFKGIGFQTFSDTNCIFQYAYVNKYIIKYSKIVNSLQLYKKYPETELLCSYGESEKSIDVCIEDLITEINKNKKLSIFDFL